MPATEAYKKALSEQEARGEFFRQMHSAGVEVESLRNQCQSQKEQIKLMEGQISILRSERDRSRTEANAVLKAPKSPIMIDTDEDWLFRRRSTLKFTQRPDGSRLVVLRVRNRKILRVRGEVTADSPTTDLIRYVMEKARVRESGRKTSKDFNGDTKKRRRSRRAKEEKLEQRRNSAEQQEVEESEDPQATPTPAPESDPSTH